jgi:oligoendopeptidase F
VQPIIPIPESPAALADATWDDVAPLYEALATVPLSSENAERWLATWSRLDETLSEAGALATISYTADTTDSAKEAAHLRFAADIAPKQDEQHVRLSRRLLDLGYTRRDLETVLRVFRTDAAIFREANVPLFSELEEIETGYERVVGGLAVEWDGETKTVPQMQPFLMSPDRTVRERAFRRMASPYIAHRTALADLFDRAYDRRQRVARNAGFRDYQEYIFQAKHRFEYTPADCAHFHDAVARTVVPALGRLGEYRARRMGVIRLRPWDVQFNVDRVEPLVPFADVTEFVAAAERVFDAVDPEFGAQFRAMARQHLLDLESRHGKAPGGYCMTLHHRGMPFIFMNAVGVPNDVSTLVHEAGHCFHAIESHRLPLLWQRSTGMEAAELASMSMELLAAPFLARPTGYYEPSDARHALVEQLEEMLQSIAHIASVDEFQSWIYTSGDGGDRDARDAAWMRIRSRYGTIVDWTGLDAERVARWYRQAHIFTTPFYYIEYGIAQLGALQLWRSSLNEHRETVDRYKAALRLGATRPLPEIYAAAGARLMFDAEGMEPLVALVEQVIAQLREELSEEPALA